MRTRANQSRNILALLCTSHTLEVFEVDVCDGQIARKFVTQSQVALSVALSQFNSPVYICHGHSVIGDVLDASRTTAALQTGFKFGVDSGPNFDAGAVLYEISLGVSSV